MRSLLLVMCVALGMSATAQSLDAKSSGVVLGGKHIGNMTQWYLGDSLVSTKIVVFAELTDYQRERFDEQFEGAEVVLRGKAKKQAIAKSKEYVDVDTDLAVQRAGKLYITADAVLYGSIATAGALVQSYAGNAPVATTIVAVGGLTSACLRMAGHLQLRKVGTRVKK